MRKRNYDNTELDLGFTIARHLNNDEIRVWVGRLRFKKAIVLIEKIPKVEGEYFAKLELNSIENKLVINHRFGDKYIQNIMEIEEQILSILNNFDEFELQLWGDKMVIY